MFTQLKRRFPGSRARRRAVGHRLQVEGLEHRSLLTVAQPLPVNIGATVASTPVVMDGNLFFAATDSTHGTQLWEYNTSSGSAAMLTNIDDSGGGLRPTGLTVASGTLYFFGTDATHGQQLWTSNGTAAGTTMVTDDDPGAYAGLYGSDLTVANGAVYFVAWDTNDGYQVFKTNGTAAGTGRVTALNGGNNANISELTAIGGTLYFQAYDSTSGYQLWDLNTSTGATTELTTGNAVYGGSYPALLTPVGSQLYFADTSSSAVGMQLWVTNGTTAGTTMLTSGSGSQGGTSPSDITAVGSTVYFSGFDSAEGYQLWETGGTAASTSMVTSINASGGGLNPSDLAVANGTLYFDGYNGVDGDQLWTTNGTPAGTSMVDDIDGKSGALAGNFEVMNGTLCFTAFTPSTGYQWWTSNGTAAGTTMLTSIANSVTDPGNVAMMSSNLYFTAAGASMWQMPMNATTPTTPTITWANPSSIVYGTALSATQLDATASVSGTFTYTPAAGAVLPAGTDTLSVTFTPSDTTDYTTASDTVSLVVNQATPTITWANPSSIVYGTALSATQLDATATVPGTFTYTPAAGALPAAGTDTLSVTFTPTDSTDYQSVTATTSVVVSQAVPTITWASPSSIVYGTALSATQLDATATVPGTFTYTPAAGALPAAGTDTLSVTFTPTDSTDYQSVTATTSVVVSQAVPTITWASPSSIVYGTALSATQLDATATVPGTFTYTPAAGTVPAAGTDTLSVTFTPTDSTDYQSVTATTSVVVSQAVPTITWASPSSIVYGTALSATQLDATATVPGTFTYTPAAGTVPAAGTDTLSVTFTPTDSTDYQSVTTTTSVVVSQAVPTITWANPSSIVYGTALSATQLDATASVSGTFTYTPAAGALPAAGTDTLSVTFTPTDSTDYQSVTTTTSVVVSQAVPTITWANPSSIVYGTALSATQLDATASVSGTFTYTPAAGALPAAGTDTLSVTFTPTDSTDYQSVTTTTSVVVSQAVPTIGWANPSSIVYGTALSATQLDATASVPGTFTYTPAAGTVPAAGTDTLSVTFTPTDSTDYQSVTATASVNVLTSAGASATFLEQDSTTSGTWIGTYGSQGYDIIGSSSSLPSYAKITSSGAQTYVWANPTTATNALETAGGSSRLAACWYTNSGNTFTVDVDLTDGQVHDLELYVLDGDSDSRAEQVQISNATTGAVLSTQSVSGFHNGTYLDYAVSGNILITFTKTGGANPVLSGLFLDPSTLSVPPAITWADPAAITYGTPLSATQLDATANVPGTFTYTQAAGTVLTAGTDTLSATFTPTDTATYATTSATATIVVNQATPTITWANPPSIVYGTALSATQLDATASVPGTFTYSPAAGTIPGVGTDTLSVTFTPTDTTDYTSASATVSISVVAGASATFLEQDSTTSGTWIGTYGSQGYDIIGSSSSLPSYAKITSSGAQTYVWANPTTATNALETAGGSSRLAACWYTNSGNTFTVDVDLTDGQVHDLELYVLDGDSDSRAEQVQISNATTGAVLSTQSVSGFHNGTYLDYAVSGNILITFTKTGGANPVLSGLFLDPDNTVSSMSEAAVDSPVSSPADPSSTDDAIGALDFDNNDTDSPAIVGTSPTGRPVVRIQ